MSYSTQTVQNLPEVVTVKLLSLSSMPTVLAALKERKVVCVDLSSIAQTKRQQVADCLAGCICAIDGQMQQLEAQVLLCTPSSVQVNMYCERS